jgi:hypothetical protein
MRHEEPHVTVEAGRINAIIDVRAFPATVFAAITDPEHSGRWVGDRLTFDGRIGSVLQRVEYELGQGEIRFKAANSFDGGRTYVTHATARWHPIAGDRSTP